MKKKLAAISIGGACCLALPLLACAHPSAVDFGHVPAIQAVALSPSGQLLAWIDNSVPAPQIEIFDLEKGARSKRVDTHPDIKLRDLDWADDDTLLIHSSSMFQPAGISLKRYEIFGMAALQVKSGKMQTLFPGRGRLKAVTRGTVAALRPGKPHKIVIAAWSLAFDADISEARRHSAWTYNLLEVDTRNGDSTALHQGTPYTADWLVGSNGEAVARSEWEKQQRRFTVLHRRGNEWVEIYRLAGVDHRPILMELSADDSNILMVGSLDGEPTVTWRLPLDGSPPRKLFEDMPYETAALVMDPHSWQPLGEWPIGPNPDVRWYDAKAQARAQGMKKTFGGKYADLVGRASNYSRALVEVTDANLPSTYYMVDYQKGTADIVGEQYPALVGATLGELRHLVYKARDGKEIPAYMTLPPGKELKRLPLVVVPQATKQARDPRQFEWMTQFLATRGYLVLQPQTRGVQGYGQSHEKAGRRQWGRLVQDDITDGVKALIEQGVVDPQRVCIVGRDYGGYAALAGAAYTPELYACAASIGGISDLPDMGNFLRRTYGPESDMLAYWIDDVGIPQDPQVIATSPARSADTLRAPVLLIHSANDNVIPLLQSKKMAAALKARQKSYEFIEISDDDRWLSRSESRIRVLTELERFLGQHLGAVNHGGS